LIFPVWVLIISVFILVTNLRRQREGAGDGMTPVVESQE
jgi:hypothetical protein